MDKRLADLLVRGEFLTRAEVQRKILKSKALKKGVIQQLWEGKPDENKLVNILVEYMGTKKIDENDFEVNPTALKFLSNTMAEKNGVLPFALNENSDRLTIVIYDPESASEVMQTLKVATGNLPEICIARKSWVVSAIRHYYYGDAWPKKSVPKAQTFERLPKKDRPVKVPSPNSNAIGRLKPRRREILTPIDMKLPLGNVESEAIVLDEISFGDAFADDSVEIPKPELKSKPKKKKRVPKKKISNKARESAAVDKALNDFDSFLENQNNTSGSARLVDPNLSDVPGWTSPPAESASNSSFYGGWEEQGNKSGFDLFSEVQEKPGRKNLEAYIEIQTKKIMQLQTDLNQQRNIIQALIDILSEKKVVSKREIKKRISS